MSTSEEYRELGMDRPIARRDFLNGAARGIATTAALSGIAAGLSQAQTNDKADNYPPLRTGLRGNYPEADAREWTNDQVNRPMNHF